MTTETKTETKKVDDIIFGAGRRLQKIYKEKPIEGGLKIGDTVYIDNTPMTGIIEGFNYSKKGIFTGYGIRMRVGRWPKVIRRRRDQISKEPNYDKTLYPGKWNLNPRVLTKYRYIVKKYEQFGCTWGVWDHADGRFLAGFAGITSKDNANVLAKMLNKQSISPAGNPRLSKWYYHIPGNIYAYRTKLLYASKKEMEKLIKRTLNVKKLPRGVEVWRAGKNPFSQAAISELVNLYHSARIAGKEGRWARMTWAADQFHKAHPETKSITAYKALDAALVHPEIQNPTLYDFMLENRQRYIKYATLFRAIFSRDLHHFWDNVTGLDVVKFDEEFIKPIEGQSTREAILAKYGQTAVDLIDKLI
jgi:hypothetical protein